MSKPKTKRTPKPLVPGHIDLRDFPVPWDFFTELAMKQFGISREEAERITLEARRLKGDLKN